MPSSRFSIASCLCLLAFAWAAPARASGYGSFDLSGVYVPVGVNAGGALRSGSANGYLLGGEISFLRFWHDELAFVGGYVDYVHDFGVKTDRVSIGPEAGLYFGGIDAGPVLEVADERTDLGVRARLFASIGLVSLYAGEVCRLTTAEGRWATEVGLLLKLPIGIASCGRGDCRWGEW